MKRRIAFIGFLFRNEAYLAPGVVATETVEVVEDAEIVQQGIRDLEEARAMAKEIHATFPAVPLDEVVIGVLTDWFHEEYVSQHQDRMMHLAWALAKSADHPYLAVIRDGTSDEVLYQKIEADDFLDGMRRVLKYLTLPEALESVSVREDVVVVDGVARIVSIMSLMKH
jgi:hypothetical protein